MASEQNESPPLIWQGATRPRIKPGDYTATCKGFQGPEWIRQFGRWGLRLEFVLDPDDQAVSAFYSLGENRDAPTIGVRSKFFRVWALANGAPPCHGEQMSYEKLADPSLSYTVRVSDCKTDDENQVKEDALVYSRVDAVLSVERISG